MSRKKIVAGNWKMNLDRAKAKELTLAVAARRGEAAAVELVLCPPALYVETVGSALAGAKGTVGLGAQNMHDKASGAFTGADAAAASDVVSAATGAKIACSMLSWYWAIAS